MFDLETLKEILARCELSNKNKILVSLASSSEPLAVSALKQKALDAGLREIANWNVSASLARSKPYAVNTSKGWELTGAGKRYVTELVGPVLPSVTNLVVSNLRNHLNTIQNIEIKAFVKEAILCFETRLFRSAIVLSWVGAVAVIYDFVVKNHLSQFNAEALKRDVKWRVAKTSDDLARMGEFDFLQVISAISVIGKNVKNELEICLKLRNGCGHPNSLAVGEHKAAAHIETLVQNVFLKF